MLAADPKLLFKRVTFAARQRHQRCAGSYDENSGRNLTVVSVYDLLLFELLAQAQL